MKYTKKQRHEIYKKALERFQSNQEIFVCNAISRINKDHDCSKINFPELFLFNESNEDAWLTDIYIIDGEGITSASGTEMGNKLRQIVLMLCIEMTR